MRRHRIALLLLGVTCWPAGLHAQAPAPSGPRPCSVTPLDSLAVAGGPIFRDCEVDRPAVLRRAAQPSFENPENIRCTITELAFIVGVDGRPERAPAVLLSANIPMLGERLMRSLPQWRYEPAMKDGVPVRQIVRARIARKEERLPFVVVGPGESPPRPPVEEPCV